MACTRTKKAGTSLVCFMLVLALSHSRLTPRPRSHGLPGYQVAIQSLQVLRGGCEYILLARVRLAALTPPLWHTRHAPTRPSPALSSSPNLVCPGSGFLVIFPCSGGLFCSRSQRPWPSSWSLDTGRRRSLGKSSVGYAGGPAFHLA